MGSQGDTGHRVDGSVSDSDGLIRGCWLGSSGIGWDTCRHFAAGDCCCWESGHFGGKIGREAARHVDGLRILQVKTSRHRPFEHVGWWQPGGSVSMTAADVIVPPTAAVDRDMQVQSQPSTCSSGRHHLPLTAVDTPCPISTTRNSFSGPRAVGWRSRAGVPKFRNLTFTKRTTRVWKAQR